MTKATIETDHDEPVLLLVIPLRKCQRSTPERVRRVIDTTCDLLPDNVVELRKAVGA
jgi:hypothetical protein